MNIAPSCTILVLCNECCYRWIVSIDFEAETVECPKCESINFASPSNHVDAHRSHRVLSGVIYNGEA